MSGETTRCIVIGGSGSVGRAVCREMAARGARVGFTYNEGEAVADELLAELDGSCARRVDVANLDALGASLQLLHEQLGGVDALVHAATLGSTQQPQAFDELEDVTPAGWNRLMTVNVASAFFACQALATLFGPAGGNVVLVGSIDGVKHLPSSVPYAVSKGALRAMVMSLAKALGKSKLRVNLVASGVLETGASRILPGELRAQYLKHCGLRRVGEVDEVAAVVTWLALNNSYVTGQTVVVDGGL